MARDVRDGGSADGAFPESGRMLRVEYKNQPYDWFNLDDMGPLVHTEEFAGTLKENINHYFDLGFDEQAIFDEDGILVSAADFLRSLRQPRPYIRLYSLRQLPQELKEQTAEKLASLAQEVTKMQQILNMPNLSVPRSPERPGVSACVAPTIQNPGSVGGSQMQANLPCCANCGAAYETENALFCGKCARLRAEEPLAASAVRTAPEASMADRLAGSLAGPRTLPNVLPPTSIGTTPWTVPGTGLARVPLTEGPPAAVATQPQGPRYSSNCMVQMEGPQTVPNGAFPVRSVSFANGKDYSRDRDGRLFDVTLSKDPTGPATTCTSCGNVFMPDSEFCRKCGVKREMSMKPDRFGFANVPVQDGRSLQITWIDPSGLLARWNTLHPNSEVKEGQIIVAVNGVSEDVEAPREWRTAWRVGQRRLSSSWESEDMEQLKAAPLHNFEGWRRRVPKADTNQVHQRLPLPTQIPKAHKSASGRKERFGSSIEDFGANLSLSRRVDLKWLVTRHQIQQIQVAKFKVKVPAGVEPGQMVYFTSPSGQQLQTKVPEDKRAGDEFYVLIQHDAPVPMQARVKVPEGVKPGEKIVFPGPHGYNLEAVVPEGKEPGDEFHVALPAPPPEQPSSFLLTVPDGKKGGDELFFDANGQHMRAIIPEGRQPGETFEVHLGPSQLLVTVPEGKQSGEEVEFRGPGGGLMKAVVPKGIKAGEQFAVSLINDPALHSGLPALCTACSNGDLEEAKKLVAASNLNVNGTFDQGFTPLFYAATSGAFEVAKWLVEERADVNASNETKRTPLHWASRNGHIKVVELLLGARAAMNGPDGTGRNPLALAIGYKQTEVVELLRKAGAEEPSR
ncbi:unnamed protein product [Durusdinium trenchii]|uniref:Uncharacterized protein n=1 Tax=Durusdinium trenchii TaxID=1381693 RepID=A0ABP0HK47_9DINO